MIFIHHGAYIEYKEKNMIGISDNRFKGSVFSVPGYKDPEPLV